MPGSVRVSDRGSAVAVRSYYSITGVAREPSIMGPLIHLRAKQTKRIDTPPDPAAGHYQAWIPYVST